MRGAQADSDLDPRTSTHLPAADVSEGADEHVYMRLGFLFYHEGHHSHKDDEDRCLRERLADEDGTRQEEATTHIVHLKPPLECVTPRMSNCR